MPALSPTALLRQVLLAESRLTLRRHSPRVVVLTGSVGKTSAKDLITPVLGVAHSVRSTAEEGNQLLPMAILGLPPLRYSPREALVAAFRGLAAPLRSGYPEWLILEVDASAPGRVTDAGKWLHPEMGVFTSVGDHPPHLEAFTSLEHLVQETAALCDTVTESGSLIVNGDDERLVEAVSGRAGARGIIRYGFGSGVEVRAERIEPEYRDGRLHGLSLELTTPTGPFQVLLPGVIGRPHAYAALAAVAVGISAGIPRESMARAISSAARQPGRLRILAGARGSTLVDDTWNPSPIAWTEALRAIGSIDSGGRKILITEGMRGVGSSVHGELGRQAGAIADMIVASGAWAELIVDAARRSGDGKVEVLMTANALESAEHVRGIVRPEDIVLVLAANTGTEIRMEHAVERLLLHPEDKKLLVRQRPWWPGG